MKKTIIWMLVFMFCIAPALAQYYNFENGAGTTAIDAWGQINGTITNGAYREFTTLYNTSGGGGNYSMFNTTGYITVAKDAPENFTIAMWAYIITGPASSALWDDVEAGFKGAGMNNAGSITFYYYTGTGVGSYVGMPQVYNEWQHLVARKNGSNVSLWKNGVMVNSSDSGLPFALSTNTNYRISTGVASGQDIIDEFKFYNESLSDAQIRNLYNYGNVDGNDTGYSFIAYIKDETTDETIGGTPVYIYITGEGFNQQLNTSIGQKVIQGLQDELYYFTISEPVTYGQRVNYINVSGIKNYTFYLINESLPDVDDVTFTIKDSFTLSPIENGNFIISRGFSGVQQPIFTFLTDVTGQAVVYLDKNVLYDFNITKEGYIPKEFTLLPSVNSYDIYLIPETAVVPSNNLTFNYSYDNSTGNLTINWTDPTNSSNNISIDVHQETMLESIKKCNATTSGVSGGYVCQLNSNMTGVYSIHVEGTNQEGAVSNLNEILEVKYKKISGIVGEKEGAFWSGLILTVIVLIGVFSPVGVIITTIFGLVFLIFLNMTSILTITFLIIAAIIGIVLGVKIRT